MWTGAIIRPLSKQPSTHVPIMSTPAHTSWSAYLAIPTCLESAATSDERAPRQQKERLFEDVVLDSLTNDFQLYKESPAKTAPNVEWKCYCGLLQGDCDDLKTTCRT